MKFDIEGRIWEDSIRLLNKCYEETDFLRRGTEVDQLRGVGTYSDQLTTKVVF